MISNITSEVRLKNGIYVYDVEKNSPAEKNGVKAGDILLRIDNVEVNTLCEVREILFSKKVEDSIKLRLLTNGIEREIELKLSTKLSTHL